MPEPKETSEAAPGEGNRPPGEEEEGGQPKVPAGIVPLFLSTQTQQIFGCVGDEHVTKENPHKFIPKEKFAEDIQNRAAVSDFQPLKKKIQVRTAYQQCILILPSFSTSPSSPPPSSYFSTFSFSFSSFSTPLLLSSPVLPW